MFCTLQLSLCVISGPLLFGYPTIRLHTRHIS